MRQRAIRVKSWGLLLAVGLTLAAACHGSWATRDPQSASGPTPQLLQDAESTYFQLDLATARQAFQSCLEEPSLPASERAEAARRLATIAWRFDLDWGQALRLLERAEDLDKDAFENALARSRLLEKQGRIEEASRAAQQALQRAGSNEERIQAVTAAGRLALHQARQSTDSGRMPETLQHSLERLLEGLQSNRGRLEASRLALGLALAADDGPAALQAWRSYYWVPSQPSQTGQLPPSWPYDRLAGPHALLSKDLPKWAGPEASPEARARVVQAFIGGLLFLRPGSLAGGRSAPG